MSLHEALKKSEAIGADLVEISPNSRPPVCRIMDYRKFIYKKNKSIKKQKKKQKIIHIKEVKFRPNTDEGDFRVKLRNLIRFLDNGNKVKVTLRFRGREITHQNIGFDLLNRIKSELYNISTIEFFSSKVEGRQIIMILSPKKA